MIPLCAARIETPDGCQSSIGGQGETLPPYRHKGRYMSLTIAPSAPLSMFTDLLPDFESQVSAPIETRFFLASVLEEALAELPGVHSVRITTDHYGIDEIEVLAARNRAPLALRVEILSLLRVGFGLHVADRCIGIVPSP
jgi:hypothetical protein